MQNVIKTIVFLGLLLLISCTTEEYKLQSGDILFQEPSSSFLGNAIDEVTQRDGTTHFSHVGLLEQKANGELQVLHAASKGTQEVSLSDFMQADGEARITVAYRLKPTYSKAIPTAIQSAHNMLGKPYNLSYVLTDTAHYCSEYVYKAFLSDSIFQLEPMTFKNPTTGEFPEAWILYYQKLGIEIPEGLPGCNPNGLAASTKLIRLGKLDELGKIKTD